MRLKWSDDAISDLEALRSYIGQDKPGAAKGVVKRILRRTEMLTDQPGIGRPGRIPGTRELVISGTPYIVPYRIRKGYVELLRVLHGAMRWPEKL